jgi:hypothetical protein
MIEPELLYRCGFAIESIPPLHGETATRACSAWAGYTLYFANIPKVSLNRYVEYNLQAIG